MAKSVAGVPTRPFGRASIPVSILALGGWHLGLPKTERESTRLVHAAIDGGITFMDNAWDYNDGVSETRMGKALVGRRDQVFLMTKACPHGRDAKTAMRQLEDSLRRLKTDYLDLWQIHEVIFEDEPAKSLRAGRCRGSARSRSPAGEGPLTSASPDTKIRTCISEMLALRLPVGRVPAAAQLLRRVVSQLRAARAAGIESARHRRHRHEEPWRRRAIGDDAARDATGSDPLHAQPADRHAGERHRHACGCSARTSTSRGVSVR